MPPLDLSIVLPSRNGAGRLATMLPMLLAEIAASSARAEIVVVDDRSTDETPRILEALAAGRPELRPIPGAGRGPGAARNAGVAVARGALVAFADDDDPWTPGRLAAQLAGHAGEPEATFSFCDYAHVREDDPELALPSAFAYWPLWRRFRGAPPIRLDDARPLIAAENAVGTSTVMVRRDAFLAVGGFDEALASASDWDLWLRLAAHGPALVLGREGARYALRAGSVSGDRAARLGAMETVLGRHPDLPAWSRRRARARIATGLSEAADERGDRRAALRHALTAARLAPGRRTLRRAVSLAVTTFGSAAASRRDLSIP